MLKLLKYQQMKKLINKLLSKCSGLGVFYHPTFPAFAFFSTTQQMENPTKEPMDH